MLVLGVLMDRLATSALASRSALVLLCAAYIQGGLTKLFNFPAAVAEQEHFGVPFSGLSAVATITTELIGSALVVIGLFRWIGAFWLAGFTLLANFIANGFWAMPIGAERLMAANGFFEHLGLVGGLIFVGLLDLRRPFA